MDPSPPPSRSASPSLSPSRRSSSISKTIGRSYSSNAWSSAEDHQLLSYRASGLNWHVISAEHFPSKTANACRKRHERLIARRNSDAWDGKANMGRLARGYMMLRPVIWGPLAAEVGEKWNVVEAKVMQYGLKNLTNAARNRKRKRPSSFSEEQTTNTSILDDSGIAVSDDDHKDKKLRVSNEVIEDVSLVSVESVESDMPLSPVVAVQTSSKPPHRATISKPSPPRTRSSRLPTIASMLRSPSPSPQVEECRSYRESTVMVSTYRRA